MYWKLADSLHKVVKMYMIFNITLGSGVKTKYGIQERFVVVVVVFLATARRLKEIAHYRSAYTLCIRKQK